MNPRDRRDLRDGLAARVRPARCFTRPISSAASTTAELRQAAGAPLFDRAIQGLIRPARPSSRSPRWPRWRPAKIDADRHRRRHRLHADRRRRRQRCNAGKTAYGTVDLRSALKVSSDVYFYNLGLQTLNSAAHRDDPDVGHAPRPRPHDGHRPAREATGAMPDRRGASAIERAEARVPQEAPHKQPTCGIADGCAPTCAVESGRQRQPRRRPGRPAGLAAADGRRLLDDRHRRARSRGRTSASRSRTAGGSSQPIDPAAARTDQIDPTCAPGGARRPARRGQRADGGTSTDVFDQGWPRRPLPGLRQDRHRRAHGRVRPVLVRLLVLRRAAQAKPIVVVGHGREAAASAPRRPRPAARLIAVASGSTSDGQARPRELARPMSAAPRRSATSTTSRRPRGRAAPGMALPFDLVLLLAVLGLRRVLADDDQRATADDVTGEPELLLQAPGDLLRRRRRPARCRALAAGLLAAARAASRALRLADGLDPAVMAVGSVATGSQRAIALPFFRSRPPSWARCCSSWSLAAFVVDRVRRLRRARHDRAGHAARRSSRRRS